MDGFNDLRNYDGVMIFLSEKMVIILKPRNCALYITKDYVNNDLIGLLGYIQ